MVARLEKLAGKGGNLLCRTPDGLVQFRHPLVYRGRKVCELWPVGNKGMALHEIVEMLMCHECPVPRLVAIV